MDGVSMADKNGPKKISATKFFLANFEPAPSLEFSADRAESVFKHL